METNKALEQRIEIMLADNNWTLKQALLQTDAELLKRRNFGRRTLDYFRRKYGSSDQIAEIVLSSLRDVFYERIDYEGRAEYHNLLMALARMLNGPSLK